MRGRRALCCCGLGLGLRGVSPEVVECDAVAWLPFVVLALWAALVSF